MHWHEAMRSGFQLKFDLIFLEFCRHIGYRYHQDALRKIRPRFRAAYQDEVARMGTASEREVQAIWAKIFCEAWTFPADEE